MEHWPRDPIRVDQRCSNETCLTRDSIIVPPALILPRRPALGGPCVLMTPATVVAKLGNPKRGLLSQTGTPAIQLNWAHRVIAVYLIRAARTHNPPSLEVPMKEHAVRPGQGRPIPANVAARESPDRWLMINQLSSTQSTESFYRVNLVGHISHFNS
jgi:hypothetical protein